MVNSRLRLGCFLALRALICLSASCILQAQESAERVHEPELKTELEAELGGKPESDRVPVLLHLAEIRKDDSAFVLESTEEILQILRESPDRQSEARTRSLKAWAHQEQGEYGVAIEEAKKVIELAEATGESLSLRAEAHYILGVVHWRRSELEEALQFALQARDTLNNLRHQSRLAETLTLLGVIYRSQADLNNSVKCHLDSLEIARELEDESAIARANNNLGLVYWQTDRLQDAYDSMLLAFAFYERDGQDSRIVTCLCNLGLILIEMGEAAKALPHLETALLRHDRFDKPFGRAKVLSNIGFAHEEMGNSEKALEFYERALRLRKQIDDRRGYLRTVGVIASLYQNAGRHDETIAMLENALPLAEQIGAKAEQAAILEILSDSYTELGKHEEALQYFQQFHTLKLELENGLEQTIAELDRRHLNAVKEKKVEHLVAGQLTLEKQLVDQSILIAGTVLLVVCLLAVGYLYYLRVRALATMRAANTELRLTANQLRESENRYRMLFETADIPTFLIDEESQQILNWNPEAIKMGASDVRQHPIPLLALEPGWVREGIQRYLAANSRGEATKDYFQVGDPAQVRWTEVRGCRVQIEGKRAQLISVRDTTERKSLEKARMREDRVESLGVLAGGIAHDFNNALMAILGYISLTKTRIGEEAVDELQLAEDAVVQASRLTNQLLAFSKGGEPVRKPQKVAPLLRQAVELARAGSGMRIDVDVEADLWPAEIDAGQFSQIVSNLVINADHATSSCGMLMVSAKNFSGKPHHELTQAVTAATNVGCSDAGTRKPSTAGDDSERKYVRIDFADNGKGIPAEIQDQIFDPYFTTKDEGSGLGLATVFTVVKRHGGQVHFHSNVGQGALFSIYLPASSASPEAIVDYVDQRLRSVAPEADSVLQSASILVLEDEPLLQKVYRLQLGGWGCEIEVYGEGTQVVSRYKERMQSGKRFDLLILDLTVPGGVGGLETFQRILELDANVLAIVASGYSNHPTIANYSEIGFKGALSKPFRDGELRKLVSELLESRHKQPANPTQ